MAVRRSLLGPLIVVVLVAGGLGYGAWRLFRGGAGAGEPVLHLVERGPLKVTVLESGSLEALASTVIASQVEGQAAILEIVPEGTVLTADDVASKRVLVKLDASALDDRISALLIELESARAAAVNAVETLAIQEQEEASKDRQAM